MSRGSIQLLAVASLLLAGGCEALVPFNWDSAEKIGERVELVVDTVPAQEARPMEAVMPRDGTRKALQIDPTLVEARLLKLVSRAATTSTRPPSSWSARTAGDFYAAPPRFLDAAGSRNPVARVEVRPGIRGFRIERWLDKKRVTVIEFSLEPAEDAFRVRLDRITVRYSRAKVADCGWMNGWTRIPLLYGFVFDIARIFGVRYGDNAVDMQIDLAFNSTWTDAHGETHNVPLNVLGWTVLDVPLGGKTVEIGRSSGWLPLPPPSVRETAAGDTTLGLGHFSLWALVTEQDDLGPEFVSERNEFGAYIDNLLGLLPVPVPSVQ